MKAYLFHHSDINFSSIPALAVLTDKENSVNFGAHGFIPGDSMELRITYEKNVIPCKENEREKYKKLRGDDFR